MLYNSYNIYKDCSITLIEALPAVLGGCGVMGRIGRYTYMTEVHICMIKFVLGVILTNQYKDEFITYVEALPSCGEH